MRYRKTIAIIALIISCAVGTASAQQPVPPPETWLVVTAKLKKVDDKGKETVEVAKDATLFAGKVSQRLDSSGTFRVNGLKPGKFIVGSEKIVTVNPLFGKKRVFRYVAAAMADLKPGENRVELVLELVTVLDDYCIRCHPTARKEIWQVVRDRHPNNVPLPDVYKERFKTSGLVLNGAGNVGCETCHTIHLDKGNPFILHYPIEGSVLCLKCH